MRFAAQFLSVLRFRMGRLPSSNRLVVLYSLGTTSQTTRGRWAVRSSVILGRNRQAFTGIVHRQQSVVFEHSVRTTTALYPPLPHVSTLTHERKSAAAKKLGRNWDEVGAAKLLGFQMIK